LGRDESPHGDGISNILKYAMGKAPEESAHDSLPKPAMVDTPQGRRFGIKVTRILNPVDVTISIQGSPDLKVWEDVSSQLEVWGTAIPSANGLSQTIELVAPYPITDPRAEAFRYLRLAVTERRSPRFGALSPARGTVGGSLMLTVPMVGEPATLFEWYRGDVKVGQTTAPQFEISTLSANTAGTYRVVARNAYGSTTSGFFVVQAGGWTYDAWLTTMVGGGVTPTTTGYGRNSSLLVDGYSNVFKYVFGATPSEPIQPMLPRAKMLSSGGTPYLGIEFDRLLTPSDISMRIEASGDLLAWRNVTDEMVSGGAAVPSADGLSERVSFRSPVAIGASGSADFRYLRVAVDGAQTTATLFQDNFDDNAIDSGKWTTSGNTVTESGQIMKVLATVTDKWGTLTCKAIPITQSGTITVSRNVRLHDEPHTWGSGTHFFMADTRLNFGNLEPVVIRYYHMDYEAPPNYKAMHGIYICRNNANPHNPNYAGYNPNDVSSWISPLWDTWFKETFVYNPQSGNLAYSINDVLQTTFNVGIMPVTASPSLVLSFDPAAWWTGHEHLIDNLQVIQDH
jgi:hypothetical protein